MKLGLIMTESNNNPINENFKSNKEFDELQILGEMISKGKKIPENLIPLLLEVYVENIESHNEKNYTILPKEYELIYAEKSRKEEILATTKSAPLQKVRTFNNGTNFSDNWENKLILGDNLKVLKALSGDPDVAGKVKLIYIDPPFATKRDFLKDQVKAYTDKVTGSAFIEFTRKRLILMHNLLAEDGIMAVHLDQKKGHYIKIIMDEIFGEHNFINEIVWHYDQGVRGKDRFGKKHDNIFIYSKSANFEFNAKDILVPFESGMTEWRYTKGGQVGKEMPEGKIPSDVWDIKLNAMSKEHIGYPTQKPEELLSRIIKAFSKENELVMDAFAGSGTTLAVSEKLKRKWIGIDCGKLSIYTIQSRFLALKSDIGNKGSALKHMPFAVFNAGLYDYKAIEELNFSEYRDFVLQLFQVRDKKHQINGVEVDGVIKTRSALIWKHKDEKNLTINEKYLQSLHDALGGKGGAIFYLIAPNSAFSFAEDSRIIGDTDYRFLRIPQSIIDELIASKGASLVQPRGEGNINDTVEALAFDFIKVPEVKRTLKTIKAKEEHLLNQGSLLGQIKISKFESKGLAKPIDKEGDELNYLAMVMIDKDYDGKIFNLSEVIFAEKIENGEVYFDFDEVGKEIMTIYVDIYGNEFREVIKSFDFKGAK